MKLKILWPGRTRNKDLRGLQDFYLKRIQGLIPCQLIEAPEARGLAERFSQKILEREARGLEKHFKDDYIVCLFDEGKEMTSRDLARFFERCSTGSVRAVTFVVGGFLGVAGRVLDRADLRLSLSKMTFSHELCRMMLLEQIYRAISIMKGRQYAK
ncbi:MAG: 23S rRNA (pseudouridine(1915)-N(3))-methyltransferase RlmH [Candidatus Aminicenantes bacterium]|nr:23S rRNA (pseudouridine(1915)-N(3))-methyltransferase RlmH [Candidatus Aminicenantes bacterium]